MGELLFLLLLFLLNGLFSMSEIALVSSRKARLEGEAARGDMRAQAALALINAPNRLLSTVQIGITLIGILTGIYSGEHITEDLKALLLRMPALAPYAHSLAVAGVVVAVTFFSLILGELVPKRIGLTYPEPIAKLMALPMRILSLATAPFIWLLTLTTEGLLKLFGVRPRPGGGVTEEEIRAMVQEGTEGGEVLAIEQDIVGRVFSLGDRRVSSLMTHRRDLVTLPLDATADEVRETVLREMHSVYPVVKDAPDEVLGVVSLKALFTGIGAPDFALARLMQPPAYVVEHLPAYKALERFKRSEQRYGLVTDEFGVVQGILTINDILEALVGDVNDFHASEFSLVERSDGSWLVDGQFPLHELLVRLGEPALARDVDVDTIGGLFLYQHGNIPKAGDTLTWMRFTIEVVDMDGARIDKVIVKHERG
ncbi:MAG: HlyC/CorC family transporter [Bacteroidetes bacterium]|nr:HlyC/CorC family transporter [Bacteroidota bacterium]